VLPCIRRALGPAQLQAVAVPRLHPARSAPESGGTDSNRRLGGHNPALCRLSYAPERSEEGSNLRGRDPRHRRVSTPGALPLGQHSGTGAPGRIRPDDLPLTRRVLCQSELQERIAGAGFEPAPVAAYEAAALPLSYPAVPCRRRDLNPHGPCAHDVLSVARLPFRHGGVCKAIASAMASAGIEPAARWASTSRSTGELQKPYRTESGTDGT
jgi:hypothetical protein